MGLTRSSVGTGASEGSKRHLMPLSFVCALAGPPNVGKSSLFNALTGLSQHTGNWTGKTVTVAEGDNTTEDITFIDLPGTYSLRAHSPEEKVALDYIKSDEADAVCAVCDGVNLERGLSLALQIIERTPKVVVCVNLMDEVHKRGMKIDCDALSRLLGVPVVATSAKNEVGLHELCDAVKKIATAPPIKPPCPLKYMPEAESELHELQLDGWHRADVIEGWLSGEPVSPAIAEAKARLTNSSETEFENKLLSRPVMIAESIACEVTEGIGNSGYSKRDRAIDRVVTHRILSIPLMLVMLAGIFWLTIVGSNYPSALLQSIFDRIEAWLYSAAAPMPSLLREMLISGALRTLFRVVAVMLPPMAIFFPLFTLLEDFGLLGRIAFNLDGAFKRASACGKQALTMCMGLGCNAAGVVGCRIIDSPRERLIAVLTNSFMPCNGRFPILITVSSLLLAGGLGGMGSALVMTAVIVTGTAVTLAVSKLLSVTVLKGEPSGFTLELPSYRAPNIWQVTIRSVFDRTIFVLSRAAAVALPAGLVIWLLANVQAGGTTLLDAMRSFLDPFGSLLGLDGAILCAFILGFPANEIVLPLVLMCYTASGTLGNDAGIAVILAANGWSTVTYINMIIMTVFHFPCSTTVLTVRKETGSFGYALLSMALPTAIGIILCAAVNIIFSSF